MAPLKPVSQTCRVVCEGKWLSQSCVNVFHVAKITPVSPITQAEIDNLASAVRAAYVAQFIPRQDGDFSLGNVLAQDLTSDTGVQGIATGTTVGTATGTSNPANVALVLSWAINRRYRGGHPRSYMAGTVNTDVLGITQWVATTKTAWTTSAAAFRTAINAFTGTGGSTWAMVAVHRFREKLVLDVPFTSPIVGVSIDSRIDSMRRRLGRAPAV